MLVHKEAGHPLPEVSRDDVVNFMVWEAVLVKRAKEEREEEKKRELAEWKKEQIGSKNAPKGVRRIGA